MEQFFKVTDKVEFVKQVLDIAFIEKYTVVLEFKNNSFCGFNRLYLREIAFPNSGKHSYDVSCHLKAFEIIKNDYRLIANLFAYVSVLSLHSNDSMVFLIADDFHNDCFSCSESFYKKHSDILDV